LKAWPVVAILVIQAILFLGHWFVYSTFIAFCPGLAPDATADLRIAFFVLAFSFVLASLLSFRYSNPVVRAIYWAAAVWLGFVSFFFWGSIGLRLVWLAIKFSHLAANPGALRGPLGAAIYSVAALTGIYGLINARIIRIRRVPIKIPNLPASWRGRKAVLMSDLHLGPINGVRFCRRLVSLALQLKPEVVFIPGDLFDGTKGDLDQLLTPFQGLKPPLGVFFSTGNHEEFTSRKLYIEAIRRAGIRVLANEQVLVDGLRIAGVLYHESSSPLHMKAALSSMGPAGPEADGAHPGILLNHAPARLPIVEQAGFSLQLSGHTHGGQFLPFTWITRRVYGRFTSGLHSFGSLTVYTSTGAGTWGPPMRVGTRPEIVLLEFE
jgi:predicted MPP superfamily phosphohydrolase